MSNAVKANMQNYFGLKLSQNYIVKNTIQNCMYFKRVIEMGVPETIRNMPNKQSSGFEENSSTEIKHRSTI